MCVCVCACVCSDLVHFVTLQKPLCPEPAPDSLFMLCRRSPEEQGRYFCTTLFLHCEPLVVSALVGESSWTLLLRYCAQQKGCESFPETYFLDVDYYQ